MNYCALSQSFPPGRKMPPESIDKVVVCIFPLEAAPRGCHPGHALSFGSALLPYILMVLAILGSVANGARGSLSLENGRSIA